jgi:NADH-quinone oxidoreductase subunit N
MNEIMVLFPEIFLGLASCCALLLGLYFRSINIFVILSLGIAVYLLQYNVPNGEVFIFNELFKTNPLIKSLQLMLLVVSMLFLLIYGGQKFAQKSMLKLYEFQVLILLSITGMLLLLASNNFLSLYVSIELQSFCLYVLAAFEREDKKSSEAGLKYFVLGSFASGLLLFGISLIYGFTGNFCFTKLQLLLSSNPSTTLVIGVIVGIVMVLIGLFFKISAAPFHMWAPDVYQGSPTIVTSFFATVAKIAAIGVLYRLSAETLASWKMDLQPILIAITCASVLVGAIGALKQSNIKRLLSYSSIGHAGYMLLAISAFAADLSVVLYLMIYVSMTLGTFAMIMNITSDGKQIVNLEDLSGLAKTNPSAAGGLAIFMFSLAGIPPFAGFFAKFYVFQTAINAGLYTAVIASVIAAVIAAYYYLKIVKIMYLDEAKTSFDTSMSITSKATIILLVCFNLLYIFV